MTSAFIVMHVKQRRGDMFMNITLGRNRANQTKLRRYLNELFNRGYISSFTLRSESLKVRWFEKYVPRVINSFRTVQHVSPPSGIPTDTRDVGIPNCIWGDDGRIVLNSKPFHWLFDWEDDQKRREKSAAVRAEREGTDMYKDCDEPERKPVRKKVYNASF
jgi:hypothetical protein